MNKLSTAILTICLCIIGVLSAWAETAAPVDGKPSGFDGKRAYGYLRQMCELGNRMSGSPAMLKQQQLIEKHFQQLGLKIEYQRFTAKDPRTKKPVPMANLIVTCHPDRKERILICAHYDTKPLPSQDVDPRQRREGVFLGANDGASGAAVLMELGYHVKDLPERYGVDLVFLDGEELVYDDKRDPFFLGSIYFAREYRRTKPDYQYVAGVLLDMVGDADLTIYQEFHSVSWEDTRPIVEGLWTTAARLGVREFIPRVGYPVRDDHFPLHQIAGIPICDVIDFQYPDPVNRYWHTTQDTPGRCSAASLEKVGRVMLAWLREEQ